MSVQTGLDSHHEQQMQDFVNMSKDRRSRTKKEISSTIQAFIDEEYAIRRTTLTQGLRRLLLSR